jgi:soluble lytic murein transglycosylase-like protein
MMSKRRTILYLMLALGLSATVLAAGAASWLMNSDKEHSRVNAPAPAASLEEARLHQLATRKIQVTEAIHEAILTLAVRYRGPMSERQLQVLAATIYKESQAAQVDPLLVAALISKESSFRPTVVSHAGAVGLMQLRPFVAEDVAIRSDELWSGPNTLREPKLNVRLGVRYYRELIDRFDGDERLALIAYNRGPTRLQGQLRNGGSVQSRYADGILRLYQELCADCDLLPRA